MTGLIGFLNWEITAISSNFISLMLILSISMCIHIINNYRLNVINQNNFTITLNNYSQLVGNSVGIEMNDFNDLTKFENELYIFL